MRLTDKACKNLKATSSESRLADGGNLYLHALPGGTKSWRFRYRFGGKQKQIVLGSYPELTLAAARRARGEMQSLLDQGLGPLVARHQQKVTKRAAHQSPGRADRTCRPRSGCAACGRSQVDHGRSPWPTHRCAGPPARDPPATWPSPAAYKGRHRRKSRRQFRRRTTITTRSPSFGTLQRSGAPGDSASLVGSSRCLATCRWSIARCLSSTSSYKPISAPPTRSPLT